MVRSIFHNNTNIPIDHGCILEKELFLKWKNRLRHAAEFLISFEDMSKVNINYHITCSAAMVAVGTPQ